MNNREIYTTDPSTRKLVNEGVARVTDATTSQALEVLRYELETFVCDGQYDKGLVQILEAYLKNCEQSQQPAVWVSGFYGSGKSHLVKMLRALWVDTRFDDGATARGIARLPAEVQDKFRELSTHAKRHGGLFAASGTLGSSSRDKSVRLALLAVIFRAAGLPAEYPHARFVQWLRSEGIYDDVQRHVEAAGLDWQEELDNLYVAEGLHEALVALKPNLFPSTDACAQTLIHLYPNVRDVSNEEMIKAIRAALSREGKMPLTLVVLDEIQQYIGEDSQRSIEVQEAVEACCKQIGGKLMFIGTGQTAITGTSNLKKLEGRFTIRIELSDTDVDAVIRQVILAKKPEAQQAIQKVMEDNLGEISRHLGDTTIGHKQKDHDVFAADYPILPVRRRFWENALRVLDQTGTESQLRNQLSMVHKAIQTNLDDPVGHVIPGDFLYFDATDRLLQARILPRKVHDQTMAWSEGTDDQRLMARACGTVFLINKVAAANTELGIRATVDTVADLLVEDLATGSSTLRGRLPKIMDDCELLLRVGDEYRIQTEESQAWEDEFRSQQGGLNSEQHRIEAERDDRIRRRFGELVGRLTLNQGESKVPRELNPVFDSELPRDHQQRVYLWIRHGWSTDEGSVLAEARQAGNGSAVVFVFIPKRAADDLRHQVIEYKAAVATLEKRGVPNGPEGEDARASMETRRHNAEGRIRELLDDAFSGVKVFQGGGSEVLGNNLREQVLEAAENALQRLYPQFEVADHTGWDKVYAKAKKGVPDALKAVGYEGDALKHPVCKAVLAFVAGGKKGAEIREHFEAPPYGWPREAINGALQVLLVTGSLRAEDERRRPVEPTELENKAIGKATFKVEAATVSTAQRIQIRKLFQLLDIAVPSGSESTGVQQFLERLRDLAEKAGGEPPMPEAPDTAFVEDIRLSAGNEQLLALYNRREALTQAIEEWRTRAAAIEQRMPSWRLLERLLKHAEGVADAEVLVSQAQHLKQQRRLLDEPDPMAPLIDSLVQSLRARLNALDEAYAERHKAGMERLDNNDSWQQLEPEQRNELLSAQSLTHADWPEVAVGTVEEVLATLDRLPLSAFSDRVAALPGRFDEVAVGAAERCEPEIQFIDLQRRTLKTEAEVEAWAEEAAQQLKAALKNGPVSIR